MGKKTRPILQSYRFRGLRISCRHRCNGFAYWDHWFLIGRQWSRMATRLIRITRTVGLIRHFIWFSARLTRLLIHRLPKNTPRQRLPITGEALPVVDAPVFPPGPRKEAHVGRARASLDFF